MTYLGDPNGAKQLWSHWRFRVREFGRRAPRVDVELNAARWLRKGFGSAGRARVVSLATGWRIECVIEGPPAHDPAYVADVRQQFQRDFVEKGWGTLAIGTVTVRILAGDVQDGKPRAQMIELPALTIQ